MEFLEARAGADLQGLQQPLGPFDLGQDSPSLPVLRQRLDLLVDAVEELPLEIDVAGLRPLQADPELFLEEAQAQSLHCAGLPGTGRAAQPSGRLGQLIGVVHLAAQGVTLQAILQALNEAVGITLVQHDGPQGRPSPPLLFPMTLPVVVAQALELLLQR